MHILDMRLENRVLFQDPRPGTLGTLSLAGTLGASRGVSANPMRVLGRYAVVFVASGGGGYRDGNGLRLPVRAGDAILLFPELPHAYGPRVLDSRAPHAWDERYVVFSGPLFDLLRAGGVLRPASPILPAPPDWRERLRSLLEAHRPPTSADDALRFAELLVGLSPVDEESSVSWAEGARAALVHDLQLPLDLDRHAGDFGLSADAFRKRFSRETGTTPARFRAARRLDAAETLLKSTAMPLRSIAEALGFVDEFHLSHAFKRARGFSPSVVRKGF